MLLTFYLINLIQETESSLGVISHQPCRGRPQTGYGKFSPLLLCVTFK